MIIRHLGIIKKNGASCFGKTLLSASYNIFLMSVLTSMYDPRAPTLATVEEERKTLYNEKELNDMSEDVRKKRTPLSRNASSPVSPNRNPNLSCLNMS